MRFLHTADWQIGMRAAHVGAAAPRVREERLAAAARVVAAARAHAAQFVLVAGDTFEDNGVERVLVQRVVDVLSSFGGPVFVAPGNHDPLVPGSVWEHPAWRAAAHVRVLRDDAPVELPGGGVLYPCVARAKHQAHDPTQWIAAHRAQRRDEPGEPRVRIGLAHGTVQGAPTDEPDYPIARDAPARCGLDFVALGHWHSTASYADAAGAVRMAYAGTHEPTRFGERDSGNALLVDIAQPGAAPEITAVRTGGLAWHVLEAELRAPGDLARLREQVEAMPEPHAALVRVRLAGLLHANEQEELLRVAELVESRFVFGRVESHGLHLSPTDPGWLGELPPGIVREAAARLQALCDPAYGAAAGEGSAVPPRPEGATPEVASWALLELFQLATSTGEDDDDDDDDEKPSHAPHGGAAPEASAS